MIEGFRTGISLWLECWALGLEAPGKGGADETAPVNGGLFGFLGWGGALSGAAGNKRAFSEVVRSVPDAGARAVGSLLVLRIMLMKLSGV